ncbi:mRNA splicing protein SAD1 [Rhodotorula paludigena]|uniref:mRNA splicing protein SAD1 n=1 Tax=Rhodotorula paludigena TaxID=86838 RepID=UPI00317B4D3B
MQDYAKLKVAELKELLKDRDLPISGLKADLVARLEQADAAAAVPDSLSHSADDAAPAPQQLQDAAHPAQPDPQQQHALGGTGDAPAPLDGVNLAAKRHLEDAAVDEAVKRIRRNHDVAAAVPPAGERDSGTAAGGPAQVREAPSFASAPDLAPVVEAERGPNARVIAEGKVPTEVLEKAANGELDQPAKEEDEEEPPEYHFEPEEVDEGGRPADLYLDTINRSALDFDFERLCSVTLSHNHIYACLVDGKYFQGRGKSSPAYAHALNEDHHVFINLDTQKVYVLPDGYEVDDASLADIKHLLHPQFTADTLRKIDRTLAPALDLAQRPYYPGFVGLNNMKHNSFMNACLHLLLHVPPLRDYFILNERAGADNGAATELVRRFGMLARKLWNPRQFKAQVSPHELLQEVGNASGGRFKITEQGDPVEFLTWLLNQLHRDLGGSRKPRSSIIYSAFQGEVRVDDQQIIKTGEFGTMPKFDLDRDIKSTKTPFLLLALDLPPPPLFQDAVESNIAPQAPLSQILAKYDGTTTREDAQQGVLRRWKITRLPPFLIVYYKRFTANRFLEEKNPTIVNFPLRGVDMSEYVDPSQPLSTYYDLTANLTHTSLAGTAHAESQWRTHVHLRAPRDEHGNLVGGVKDEDEKWFEVQDLRVEEIEREMVALGETYVQIWERRTPTGTWDLPVETPKPRAPKTDAKPKPPAAAAAAAAGGANGKKP